MPHVFRNLLGPFYSANGISKTLLGVWIVLNAVVLANALLHDPSVGYDANYHLAYIETLAQGRLPTPEDSKEYFSPPLPYVFPALLVALAKMRLWWAAKCVQLLDVCLSVGLTYYLLKICDLVKPGDGGLKMLALLFTGILPAYYKAFAFVRGEPFVAFLAVLIVYRVLLIYVQGVHSMRSTIALGVTMGLVVLSRQWGFLLFPAIILFVGWMALKHRQKAWSYVKSLSISLAISFLIGGWFYLSLLERYGTVAAFNRTPQTRFALTNQPAHFYLGLGAGKLFKAPVRSSFPNQLFPIFYSDLWGDYWGYFTIYARNLTMDDWMSVGALDGISLQEQVPVWVETNRFSFQGYLGRVNLLSLLPSGLICVGIGLGVANSWRFVFRRAATERMAGFFLFTCLIASTWIGYFWFLLMYPSLDKGNTIKAVFMLHLFPLTAIMAGHVLQAVQARSGRAYRWLLVGLVIVWLHNLPAMVTRYIPR